jgi:hypothetical protein
MDCFGCGQSVDNTDRFCRHCGASLSRTTQKVFWPRRVGPQDAASYWENFFRPFFKMAFIFMGCFFAFSFILVAVWYFMFHR